MTNMNEAMRNFARKLEDEGFTQHLLDSYGKLPKPVDPFIAECVSETLDGEDMRLYVKKGKGLPNNVHKYVSIGEIPNGVKVIYSVIHPNGFIEGSNTPQGSNITGFFDNKGNPAEYGSDAWKIQELLFE